MHKTIRDLYYKKFPELESIVFNPIEYVRCVQKIQNETVKFFIFNYKRNILVKFKRNYLLKVLN